MRLPRTVAIVVAALLVALPACGKKTDETARAAGITPADAIAFLSVSLDPSIEQKRNLLGIARRFPDADVKDEFGEARDDLLAEMLGEVGLDYAKDVKPWLGSELAVAGFPGQGGDPVPQLVVLIEQDDEEAARSALDKAVARIAAENGPRLAYRLVDDFAVVGVNESLLDAFVAEAKEDGGDLAADREFADPVDQLHGDRLLLGWVDSKAAIETLSDVFEGGALPTRLPVDAMVPVAFDFHAGSSSLVLEAVGRSTTKGSAGDPAITRSLPQGVFAALTLFDLRSGITQALEAMIGTGGDPFAEFEAETGIDLEGDVLSWVGGEVVLTASASSGGSPVPQAALVVKPSDRARAEAAVPRIADAIGQSIGAPLEQRQVAGVTAYVLPPVQEDVQPAMALFDDRFVLASTPAYLERLAEPAGDGIGETDTYQSVLGESASDDTRFQVFLDIDAVREALEPLFTGDDPADRADYDRNVKPNVEPFDALGLIMRRDGDYERAELKLTFD